jgi:hypothetical protein
MGRENGTGASERDEGDVEFVERRLVKTGAARGLVLFGEIDNLLLDAIDVFAQDLVVDALDCHSISSKHTRWRVHLSEIGVRSGLVALLVEETKVVDGGLLLLEVL